MIEKTTTIHGVIRGKVVELDHETGLPDGQDVTVTMRPVQPADRPPLGEGIRRSAGGWGDDPDGLDEFLEWNRQQRKLGRPEIAP